MSWPTSTLGSVCDFENGDRGKNYPGRSSFVTAGVPFVNAGDLDEGSLRNELSYISEVQFRRLSNGKFTEGDILFCLRGTLGKFALIDRPTFGAIASSLIIIRPRAAICRKYLKHYLGSKLCKDQIELYRNGAAQPNLAASSLRQFEVPLPPLDEQRRIAAILDKADALRRKRKRACGLLDALTQSLFLDMFGDPKGGFNRWPEVYFSEACQERTSQSEKVQRSTYLPSGQYPIVDQGQNFIAGWTDDDNKVTRLGRPVVIFGDHTRVVKYVDFDFVVGADGAKVLVPTLRFNTLFFSSLLRLMPIPDLGYSRHMRALKELRFMCPPLDLQESYSAVVQRVGSFIETLGRSSEKSDVLFSSLQHRAFSGQL